MLKKTVLTSNYAAAYAAKLARVEVVAAYPITPQTHVVEKLDEFIEKRELKASMIRVESEHSAMSACIGASAGGARVFTATSSHGLMYMYEMLWWAAGARLPIVMGVVTRALAPPWSIWTDHADILSPRDSGWIIFFAEGAQEVLDTIIQAFKIAENEKVLLPTIVGWDAFISSHTAEPVNLPSQEEVDKFLPPRKPLPFVLDTNNPISHGNLAYPDRYMEFRYMINKSMEYAKKVIENINKEYQKTFGRDYGGLIEEYKCSDSDYVIFTIGALAGDAKDAIDKLRKKGEKVGVCKIRVLRPFPKERVNTILKDKKGVIIVERDYSMGLGGIIETEIKRALYERGTSIPFASYIVGLGGRDVSLDDFIAMARNSIKEFNKGKKVIGPIWYGLRGEFIE